MDAIHRDSDHSIFLILFMLLVSFGGVSPPPPFICYELGLPNRTQRGLFSASAGGIAGSQGSV